MHFIYMAQDQMKRAVAALRSLTSLKGASYDKPERAVQKNFMPW